MMEHLACGPQGQMSHLGFMGCGKPAEARWCVGKNRYIGVRFQISGETHYGWIRLTVTTDPNRHHPSMSAEISAYAYETVPNKPIKAGTATTAAVDVQGAKNVQHVGPSLGMLAGSADALPMWRREETSVRE